MDTPRQSSILQIRLGTGMQVLWRAANQDTGFLSHSIDYGKHLLFTSIIAPRTDWNSLNDA